MTETVTVEVPGYAGRGIAVDAGSTIRLTDVEGHQVADLFVLVKDNPTEFLCTARTRALTRRLFPAVDQYFFTNHYRPILRFVADHTPGVHDTLYASCDPGLHEILGGGTAHRNCHENYQEVARSLGVDDTFVPAPVNFFQNTPVSSDGTLSAACALTRAGDHVELQAEIDLLLIVTACSVDTGSDINGGESTTLCIDVTRTLSSN
ncbi:MAG: urea carboxylase-associated family protein [Pseudomonadota bacterium]